MKKNHPFLKIAGVKNIDEFYQKFPTEAAFMKKHGKELKKAQGGASLIPGLEGTGGMPNTSFVNSEGQLDNLSGQVSKSDATSLGYGTNAPVSDDGKKGFDYGKLAGAVIGAAQDAQANSIYNKKLDQYLDLSKLISGIKPKKEPKPNYLRPETQLVTGATPKGIPAKNGAMIGGNPTEIQNMYTSGDIYTDLGNTNPKQYGWGGQLADVNAGWNNDGVTADMSPGWQAASNIPIPIVKDVIEFMGKTEANEQAGMIAKKRTPFFNNLAASAIQNVNAGQFTANVKYGGSIDSMERGGYVSNDWMPQVITTFGEHKLKDLLKPPHDADMLRAGGHLKYYTPPSAEAMNTDRAEFGAEIQTLWGGDIKQVGVNPILGPLGMLSGAQHSERAPDAIGKNGIGIQFGNNVIEAENREGIAMLANGGEIDPATGKAGKSAYIFGAEKIQGWAKKAIEDPDIKVGTTFKHWFDSKSKLQKKLNKQELAAREELANFSVDDSYDQLKMNRLMKTLDGIEMQNIDLAKYIANGAAVQTAINETDEEMGTAKYGGKLKKAAFGAKMTTAQKGINLTGVDPTVSGLIDLLKRKGFNLQVTSGLRPGAKTKSGNDSRHGVGEAVDVSFPKLGSKAYDAILKDQDVVKYMMEKGLTAINEYDPKIMNKTGATSPHIHFGFDKGTGLADAFRNSVRNTYENIKDVTSDLAGDVRGVAGDFTGYVSDYIKSIGEPDVKQSVMDLYQKPQATKTQVAAPKKVPVTQPAAVTPKNVAPIANKQRVASVAPVKQLPIFDALDLEVNRRNDELLAPKRVTNSSEFPSPIDEQGNYYMSNSEYTPIEQEAQEEYTPIQQPSGIVDPRSKFSKGLEKLGNNLEGFGNQVMTGLESALPYLRPSNQMPMDPQALTGEMFALATNQLEPVQAQKFVPYLTQGIQVSLQDQMNEVTAQTRAAERLARGNPEALAMIAAQAYDAKNKIKGEEFRLNQVEKQRVAETNRQVLNEANKMNLGIMDEQYVRQQTANSKTKEQARVALNSISDKILKNKFDNKELGIYENLYGFRFGPNGQAYNTNLTTFNTPNVGAGATSLNNLTQLEKEQAILDARKAKAKTATAGQGGIVKSMHEL